MPRENDLSNNADFSLSQAVELCRNTPEFLAAVRELYQLVDSSVNQQAVRCLGGGTCCRFDRMGHRLYVSTGELALLTMQPPTDLSRCAQRRCPYQVGTRCHARKVRPLGCRMFFCSPESDQWSHTHYEQFHNQLRMLHQQYNLPYFYCELTQSLQEVV